MKESRPVEFAGGSDAVGAAAEHNDALVLEVEVVLVAIVGHVQIVGR